MKKHLLGLGIFSFIVVSFAVAFLYAPVEVCPITQIEERQQPVFETDRRNKCNYSKTRSENPSIKITQATLTERYYQFQAVFETKELRDDEMIRLHLFVTDGKQIEQIETIYLRLNKSYSNKQFAYSVKLEVGKWKNKFIKNHNFYVIPEVYTNVTNFNGHAIDFDLNKAVPILLN